jgi:hypothetical protein
VDQATPWRQFLGLNIKGTPAMPARAVAHDLRVAKRRASVVAVQEFKWPWYWRQLGRVLPARGKRRGWQAYPNHELGLARPGFGAQAILWSSAHWRKIGSRRALLHEGEPKISERRWLRAALLADRQTGRHAWFGSTHFVVGGDRPEDGPIRQAMLSRDLDALDKFLALLTRDGHPVVFQLDANLRSSSGQTYRRFRAILKRHGAQLHGNLKGVEFLFTIDGKRTAVEVRRAWEVPVSELRTDHEGRGITFRLAPRVESS